MNHGTTASLICPACGQAFLSLQHAMEGTTQCPHCAHTAPRSHFSTQAQVAGVAQVRRRVAQAPHVQAVPPPAPQFQPQPQTWQPAPAPVYAPPPVYTPPHIARSTLQHSQALLPVHTPPPSAEVTLPPRLQPSPWRHAVFTLVFMGACGVSLFLWWNHTNAPTPTPAPTPAPVPVPAPTSQDTPLPQEPELEVRKAEAVPTPPPPQVNVALQDTQAFAADAKALVDAFFAATTPAQRAACIHDGTKLGTEIEALFGPRAAQKIERRQLAHLPGVIQTLPGGQHVPLFKLTTSACPNGALLRLETDSTGKRRLSWPLLVETHQDALGRFLRQDTADPAWFHVALRPSHGLDLPADLRSKYLTFSVQTSATAEPHFIACVERDTPLARFLDRESDWGKVYLSRLLVRKLDIKADAPCLTIVDCEGTAEH